MSTILRRPINDFQIGAGAALGHIIASGDATVTGEYRADTDGSERERQYGIVVSLDLKLIEKTTGGIRRSLSFVKLECGESADGDEPVSYDLDLGTVNKGKLIFNAKPDNIDGPDGMPTIRGKDVSLDADLLGTETADLTAIEGKLGKNLWFKVTSAGAAVWKIKNVFMVHKPNHEYWSKGTPVYVIGAKKHVEKISDILTVPSGLTLLTTLETDEGVPKDLKLLTDDGKTHTLAGMIYSVGCTLDFSYDGKPTWDIIASRYAAKISDIYSYA